MKILSSLIILKSLLNDIKKMNKVTARYQSMFLMTISIMIPILRLANKSSLVSSGLKPFCHFTQCEYVTTGSTFMSPIMKK